MYIKAKLILISLEINPNPFKKDAISVVARPDPQVMPARAVPQVVRAYNYRHSVEDRILPEGDVEGRLNKNVLPKVMLGIWDVI